MMRKAKNGITTGGRSCGGKLFSPTSFGGETLLIDQAAERRRQRDRETVALVRHVGPGDQHFGARLLIVPARLDRGHLGRLILMDIVTVRWPNSSWIGISTAARPRPMRSMMRDSA